MAVQIVLYKGKTTYHGAIIVDNTADLYIMDCSVGCSFVASCIQCHFVAVDVAQFGHPISEQVAKIIVITV